MSLANVTRQSFTRPYHSSHQTSCLTSSLPKAAQENHQTTLKESKNHTMVKKIYHKKNVHSWRDLDGRAEPLHARPCPLKPPNTPSHLIPSASHPSHLTTLAFHHYHHSTAFTILQVTPNQTALSRISARTRSPAGRGTNVPRSAKTIRPTEVSAKVPIHPADHAYTTRETIVPRSAKPRHATPRTTMARAGKQASRPRNLTRVPRPMHPSEPGKRPRPAEKPSAKFSSVRPPGRPRNIRPRPFRLGQDPTVRPTVPTDRPNAAVDPKPFLKPNPHNSSPKPAPT
ncbi:unnamed protein product [Microthlaspi erraticum]|uniref:Uncharacterized protein n=1 Tax=Microthlaspi erraticum TaxID=1685480 RepID=A0A6D2IQU7_9BRAS|nr:unnamed protein product [Microthlaspi erraticum]